MPIYQLTLQNKRKLATDVILLQFTKPEGFNFIPGQYGGFTLPIASDANSNAPAPTSASNPSTQTRRFSLCSIPSDATLDIMTRLQPSPFKIALNQLAIGETIKFAGPSGNFTLPEASSQAVVLLAGGIGIAPFYSMVRAAYQTQKNRPIYLFYGNINSATAALMDELTQLANRNPNLHFIPTFDHPDANWQGAQGYISHTLLRQHLPNLTSFTYYVCGSPSMVANVQETLLELDIPTEHIKVEDFPGY